MAELSSYPAVTTLAGTERIPVITTPGIAGGNRYITAANLYDDVATDTAFTSRYVPAAKILQGVDFTGVVDATTLTQAFLASLVSGDFAVVPCGTLKITGPLELPQGMVDESSITILWCGTRIESTHAGVVLQVNQSITNLGHLIIDCNSTASSKGLRFGGNGVGCRNASFARVDVFRAAVADVEFASTSGFPCYYNTIDYLHARYGTLDGVLFYSAGATNETNANHIKFASIQNNGRDGVRIDGGDGNSFGYAELESNTGWAYNLLDAIGFFVAGGWAEGNAGTLKLANYPTVKGVIDVLGQSDGTFAASISQTFSADRSVRLGRGADMDVNLGWVGFSGLDVGVDGTAAGDQNLSGPRLRVSSPMIGYRLSSSEKSFTLALGGGTPTTDPSYFRVLDETGDKLIKASKADGVEVAGTLKSYTGGLDLAVASGNIRCLTGASTFLQIYGTGGLLMGNGTTHRDGAGSPEGVVTAPIGSTFHRSDGGVGTSFYVKESGAGNTGWVAAILTAQTAAEILTAIKTVDGAGSGLDADLLDGISSAGFATAAQGATADLAILAGAPQGAVGDWLNPDAVTKGAAAIGDRATDARVGLYWLPPGTWDGLAFEVTGTVAGATCAVWVFADTDGRPGVVLADTGSVAAATAGVKSVTSGISIVSLGRWVWAGVINDTSGSPTAIRYMQVLGHPRPSPTPLLNSTALGYRLTSPGAYGAAAPATPAVAADNNYGLVAFRRGA